ncbi:matrixin family metalloprotease [Arthrobacter sp. MDT3-44]
MAVELAHAFVSVTPSFKGMQTAINKEFGGAEKTAGSYGVAMGKNLGSGFADTFKKVAGPALAVFGAGAIAGFAKDAVAGFSELEDSSAAAGVVFGKNMDSIIKQSATASKTMGLTQQQVINAANTFGTYGKAAGLSGQALADFSTEQTQLAADMASFKGTSPEQAIEAIGAALRGETEPIRAYGVMLDDASLKNEALAQGLITSTKEALSPQNKTLAAQALILKQTADAQGDFARTSDSTANVAKTLTAETADLSAKFGSVLAPAFTAARTAAIGAVSGVSGILDKVVAFQGVLSGGGLTPDLVKAIGLNPSKGFGLAVNEGIGSIRAFGAAWKYNDGEVTSSGLPGFMEKAAFKIRQGLEGVLPVVTQLGPPLVALLMALSPVQLVFQALLPVLPQVSSIIAQLAVIAGQLTAVIADGLVVAMQILTPIISGVLTVLAGFVGGITSSEAGMNALMTTLAVAGGVWAAYQVRLLATTVATNAHILATKAQAVAAKAAAAGQWLMNGALVANPIGIVVMAVAGLVAGLVYFFTQTKIGRQIVETVWGAIKTFIGGVARWFQTYVLPTIAAVLSAVSSRFEFFRDVAVLAFTAIRDKIGDAWGKIRGTFDLLKSAVQTALPKAFEAAKDGIGRAWDAIKAKVREPVVAVIKFINEGLIARFNDIPGVDIKPLKAPPGFANGGYTGDGRKYDPAGIVHKGEYVFTKEQTAALGKERLASMAHAAVRGGAASVGEGNMGGFFTGNANAIARHGAYYLKEGPGVGAWNFRGAAALWNGAAGVKVGVGTGKHQGYVSSLERGNNILGYTTGTNIDMSPSWAARLGAAQRRTVAAHEIGHALGLPHNSSRSIMQPNLANMASTPTAVDIRNLQSLYPGGTGRAGSENPFEGLIDGLMGAIKKRFPGSNMFVDAAGGLAKTGIEQVMKMVTDIKNGIKNIAGNVFEKVKGFFGGGAAMAPTLYDNGGVLPTNGGRPFLVQNKTRKPEYIFTNREMRELSSGRGGDGVVNNYYGPVGLDPEQLARAQEISRRRAQTMAGMGGMVIA